MSASDPSKQIQVFSVETHLGSFLRMKMDAAARLQVNRDPILVKLRELHATSVSVTYSGSGDSGQIDEITVSHGKTEIKELGSVTVVSSGSQWDEAKRGWIPLSEPKSVALAEALEDFVYDWLETTHPGWGDNDGADGEFSIDVAEGAFQLGHRSYYVESEHTEHHL